MIYIRSKKKEHGKANQIEGKLDKGQKIVIIEDLISTGQSVLDACTAATNQGAEVLGVMAIFTYELESGKRNFEKNQTPLVTLTNYSTLIDTALANKYIDEKELALLQAWKKDPEHWELSV
ncbi:orotate phosphoribosyltransferase [Tetragenococcus muriaticus 3MR10-3]|uniref:Orotate phosphoribosyltransferase n=2 Tax=Tetragenococcus muriaticus TaxID=64642 RepID=A0A091CCX2_9ENTE|nr:orotate phosphoribosyltransferase [Tetragenococcus muriaticus 3MR10-3]